MGIDGWRGLADRDCDTVFTFGLWWMRQNSAVFSIAAYPELRNNYGIQFSPLIADSGHNYGLSLGFVTTGGVDGNHGLRIGVFEFGGVKFEKIQFIGVNCFDMLHLSLYNRGDQAAQIGLTNLTPDHDNDKGYFQLGLFNSGDTAFQIGLINWHPSRNTAFQIGLLNYNPHSYIFPMLPLVNFGAKPKEEPHPPRTTPVKIMKSGEGKTEETVYH